MKRRNIRSKSLNVTGEDLLSFVGGVAVGVVSNRGINAVLPKLPANIQEMARKGVPLIKTVVGGYVASNKKMDRRLRVGAAGVMSVGVMELGNKFMPQYFELAGTGETYGLLGMGSADLSDTPIPVVMGDVYDDAVYDMPNLGNSHSQEMADL